MARRVRGTRWGGGDGVGALGVIHGRVDRDGDGAIDGERNKGHTAVFQFA